TSPRYSAIVQQFLRSSEASIPSIKPPTCRNDSYRLNRGAIRSITAPYAVHHRSASTLSAAATAAILLFDTNTGCSPGGRAPPGRHAAHSQHRQPRRSRTTAAVLAAWGLGPNTVSASDAKYLRSETRVLVIGAGGSILMTIALFIQGHAPDNPFVQIGRALSFSWFFWAILGALASWRIWI